MSSWCMCPNANVAKEFEAPDGSPLVPGVGSNKGVSPSSLKGWRINTHNLQETFEERLQRYLLDLSPNAEALKKMFDAFVDELQLGMNLHRDMNKYIDPKQCSFKMLDSYVKTVPTGTEQGTFYAIDFGGTNLRSVRCELKGNSELDITQSKSNLCDDWKKHPKGLMDKNASATDLFDFFADSTLGFMKEKGDLDRGVKYNVGFTFSFPCKLRQLDSATLVEWTKDFETGRDTNDKVEGQDVASLLQAAFDRRGVPGKVCAVMNDTVGTLLSCAYEMDHKKHPTARVGVILGTGMNACYYDDSCKFYNYEGNIINIECGNFNRALPRCSVDMEVDFASANRGAQLLEKMVSGAYLGELCRRTLVKVFQNKAPAQAWNPHTLTAECASNIATDDSPKCKNTQDIIKEIWGEEMAPEQCLAFQRICMAIFERSASLAAVFISACAHKTGYLQPAMGGVTIGVDGSLYKCNKFYRKHLRNHIKSVVGEDRSNLLHLVASDDGSGKGAGIVAAQLVGA